MTMISYALLVIILIEALSGCVRVRPYQREHLARPNMQLARDPQASEIEQHVYETREGAAGGTAAAGGGCGCN